MVRPFNMRNVLYFQSAQRQSNLAQLAGVRRFAQDARWRVNVVEYASSADDTGVGGRGKPDVKRLLEFWRPDGVIVACGAAPDMFKKKDFRGTAVTFLDGEHRLVGKDAVCIVTDDRLIAEVAAKELLRRDCRALAWVDWVKPIDWSERRGRAFREFARLNGKPCLEFVPPRKATAESWFAWKLEEWLRIGRGQACFRNRDWWGMSHSGGGTPRRRCAFSGCNGDAPFAHRHAEFPFG